MSLEWRNLFLHAFQNYLSNREDVNVNSFLKQDDMEFLYLTCKFDMPPRQCKEDPCTSFLKVV